MLQSNIIQIIFLNLLLKFTISASNNRCIVKSLFGKDPVYNQELKNLLESSADFYKNDNIMIDFDNDLSETIFVLIENKNEIIISQFINNVKKEILRCDEANLEDNFKGKFEDKKIIVLININYYIEKNIKNIILNFKEDMTKFGNMLKINNPKIILNPFRDSEEVLYKFIVKKTNILFEKSIEIEGKHNYIYTCYLVFVYQNNKLYQIIIEPPISEIFSSLGFELSAKVRPDDFPDEIINRVIYNLASIDFDSLFGKAVYKYLSGTSTPQIVQPGLYKMIKPLVSQSIYLKLILEYFEHIEYLEYKEEHNQPTDDDLSYSGYYLIGNLVKIMYNDKNFIIKVLRNFLKSPNHKHHKIFCYMCGTKEIADIRLSKYYNIIFKSEHNFLESSEIKFQIKNENINEIINDFLNYCEAINEHNCILIDFRKSVILFCGLHYFLRNFDDEFSEFTTILEKFKTEILNFFKNNILYDFLDNNLDYLLSIIKKDCDVWEESDF
ncbi:hypothetical protein DMUE_0695 [Dictyocoela muelleri]|nr:hypothetical protein DMUE_0695 [Dictyocoela muelleri]